MIENTTCPQCLILDRPHKEHNSIISLNCSKLAALSIFDGNLFHRRTAEGKNDC